jgi:hypothetical protein
MLELIILKSFLSFIPNLFKTRAQLQIETVFLRKQLEIIDRSNEKIKIKNRDRFFFVVMKSIFNRWRESLIIIKPETVIKWHRKGFKLYWRWKYQNRGEGNLHAYFCECWAVSWTA